MSVSGSVRATTVACAASSAAAADPYLTLSPQRIIKAAQSGSNFLSSLYSFLKSNDDIIGVAVSDAVSGRYSTTTNWTVLDKALNTNGAFKLEMH